MRTLLTLDYEVFFGPAAGTVARCMLEPTEALRAIARRHGAKLVFFVDAGFLGKLAQEGAKAPALAADLAAIRRQLDGLVAEGHEIQLHVHPHWETSRWTARGWEVDTTHFTLQSFTAAAIRDIVLRYAKALRDIAGADAAFAYRAGGWVIQPFAPIRGALLEAGVTIDSTVFAGGKRAGAVQPFDFRGAPAKSRWRFDADPLVEDPAGPFLEVPIASRRVGPGFYWRLAAARKLGGARHRAFGDGRAVAMEGGDLVSRLVLPSTSVVSLDGYKASFLAAAAADHRRRGLEDFVVIGHPKALTRYGLEALDRFLAGGVETATFAAYRDPAPRAQPERIAA